MLVLRLMDPKVSTVKIFSAFQKLVLVHSNSSPTRIAIAQWGARSHRQAPTSTELCNKVLRGSRRKLHPPSCELISYLMYLFSQHQLYCAALASLWRSLPLVLSLKRTLHLSSPSTPQLRSRHPRAHTSVRHCYITFYFHLFNTGPSLPSGQSPGTVGTGVTDQQRQSAYATWLQGQ